MSDANANPPTVAGQPLWVVIAAAVVAVLIIGGGAWWFMRGHNAATTASAKKPLIGMMGDNLTALDTTMPAKDKLCSTTLTRALDFGALPAGATLTSQDAQDAQPEGHYTCTAQGSDGKYTLAIDTNCAGTQDKTCYALDTVKRDDGTMVYKRRNWPS